MIKPKQTPPVDRVSTQAIPVGVGAYTSIHSFYPPTEASEGEVVPVDFYVQNTSAYPIYIAATCDVNGSQVPLAPEYENVAPGASVRFQGAFYMPNTYAAITIYAYYWTGTEWYLDDQQTKTVALVTIPGAVFSDLTATYAVQ